MTLAKLIVRCPYCAKHRRAGDRLWPRVGPKSERNVRCRDCDKELDCDLLKDAYNKGFLAGKTQVVEGIKGILEIDTEDYF